MVDGGLASALPAVVLEVMVTPGEAVKSGQKLLLLESMKTVLTIQAPRDGVVAAVLCSEGEAVPAGVPLVELE
jgi:3-methylcrotonyl-CoA carboxylase alpha subunit